MTPLRERQQLRRRYPTVRQGTDIHLAGFTCESRWLMNTCPLCNMKEEATDEDFEAGLTAGFAAGHLMGSVGAPMDAGACDFHKSVLNELEKAMQSRLETIVAGKPAEKSFKS